MLRDRLLAVISLAFACFQLIVPPLVYLIDLRLRAIHVFFGISTALLAFPLLKKVGSRTGKFMAIDILLIILLVIANLNIYLRAFEIYSRPGELTNLDIFLGIVTVLTVLEATRRSVGLAIPFLVLLLFFYALLGHFLPGTWKSPGLPFKHIIESVYWSPLGIYGSVTGMSATFISMFIIFGAILSATGGGKTFVDLALYLTGRFRGGPAKAAVIASAMFGSISGSTVANVSVTGTYTIPLMKKLGLHPNFAGAVEATASSGGGITPPIMSITAFMMADFLGIPYIKIIGYALIPCLMFYTCIFFSLHFQCVKEGIKSLSKEEIPKKEEVLTFKKLGNLFLPLIVLIVLLLRGFDLVYAGFYTCVSAAILSLFTDFSLLKIKGNFARIGKAISEGGKDLARIVPVMVAVNIVVNLIGITGIAPKISGLIIDIGANNLYAALGIATLVPLLLGTALTIVPVYVLSVALLVPALQHVGADIVAAHFFFIYWGILGGLTPPVGLTAIVAAGIAGGNWLKTCLTSIRLGIVAFVLPFFFIYNPALLGRGPATEVFLCAVSGLAGAVSLAYGFFGTYRGRLNPFFRIAYFTGGILMLTPHLMVTLTGVTIVLSVLVLEFFVLPKDGPNR